MFDLIRGLPKRFGYIHKSELTEDFLCYEIGKFLGDPTDYSIEPELEDEFFKDMARVESAQVYLRATAAKDMQRFFGAPKEQQETVRGAFARTVYFRSKISKANE